MTRTATPARWVARGAAAVLMAGLCAQVGFSSATLIAQAIAENARAAEDQGEKETALWSYKRATAWFPFDPSWHHRQGVLQRALGNNAAADAAFARALALAPHDLSTLIPYAELLTMSGDVARATELVARARAVAPTSWRVEDVAGLLEGLTGNHARAAVYFERALELSLRPDMGVVNQLANALNETGEFERALTYADRAVARQVKHPGHRLVRGKILLALDRPDEAARALGRAERIYGQRVSAGLPLQAMLNETRRYLVRAEIGRHRADRAAEAFARLSADVGPHEAAALLRGVSRKVPLNAEEHVALANALASLGREAGARLEYQEALRDPGFDPVSRRGIETRLETLTSQ